MNNKSKDVKFKNRREKREYFKSRILDNGQIESDIRKSTAYLMDTIDDLRISIEKGTYETNKLTNQIKILTIILVIIGSLTIILMTIQLLIQFHVIRIK